MYFALHSSLLPINFEVSIKTKIKMKKLSRIKNESSMLGGVCLGIADYFDIDVTLVRILFAVSFFSPIPIVIAYIIMWIIMPVAATRLEEHTATSTATNY